VMTIDITPEAVERLAHDCAELGYRSCAATLRALSAALTASQSETAAAYEVAAQEVDCGGCNGNCLIQYGCCADDARAIRALTPADSKAALERMLAEARAETAANWQPIETAPNIRGVRIIGWCVFPLGAEAREVKGYIPLDRMDAVQWFYGSVLQNVTHWMPLPPPPKGTPHE
jgi:Protein of unknown function (DUF551)